MYVLTTMYIRIAACLPTGLDGWMVGCSLLRLGLLRSTPCINMGLAMPGFVDLLGLP